MAARVPINVYLPSLHVQSLSLQMQHTVAEEHFSKPCSAPGQDWELHNTRHVCPVVRALFTTQTPISDGDKMFSYSL